jgi:hypothetical protein
LPRFPPFRNKQDEKLVGLSKQTMYPIEGFNPSFLLALPSWKDRKSENDKGNKSFNHNCELGIPISILSMQTGGLLALQYKVYSNDE